MNKQVMKDFDTNRIPIERLMALLQTFTLKHSARQLADILERAENNQSSYREFLLDLLETEVRGRNERRRKRNYSAAHFPPNPKPIELFDPAELESGITAPVTVPTIKSDFSLSRSSPVSSSILSRSIRIPAQSALRGWRTSSRSSTMQRPREAQASGSGT